MLQMRLQSRSDSTAVYNGLTRTDYNAKELQNEF
jgi:hypothetical protein